MGRILTTGIEREEAFWAKEKGWKKKDYHKMFRKF